MIPAGEQPTQAAAQSLPAHIRLSGLDFFAHHGVGEAERATGNRYTVDVWVTYDLTPFFEDLALDDLNQTLDYAELYAVVTEVMNRPTRLLESLCRNIILGCFNRLGRHRCLRLGVRVTKHNPPVGGVVGSSSVELECLADHLVHYSGPPSATN
jgi:dihydroneopterin aldolase